MSLNKYEVIDIIYPSSSFTRGTSSPGLTLSWPPPLVSSSPICKGAILSIVFLGETG